MSAPGVSDLSAVILMDGRGNACSLREVRGRPVIIASSAQPLAADAESAEQTDRVRAELRGLGAALLFVAPASIWLLQPDDEPEAMRIVSSDGAGSPVRDAPSLRAALAAGARIAVGGGAAAPPDSVLTIAMVDEDGQVTWRWCADAAAHADAGGDARLLLLALRRAAELRDANAVSGELTLNRRTLLASSLAAALFAALAEARAAAAPARTAVPAQAQRVTLDVNDKSHTLQIEARVTLLDALRENLHLTGTKKGCDHGQCGACTVLVDGRRIDSCLTLAIMHQGSKITTIEGLASGSTLHPMQAAFLECDGFQCGYCTPGQIMSAVGLLAEGHAHSAEDVRELMSGNLCRCGAYPNIISAIEQVRKG
jgi:xanthine dehydrogenase YagT iron-sulfur-binding subunit